MNIIPIMKIRQSRGKNQNRSMALPPFTPLDEAMPEKDTPLGGAAGMGLAVAGEIVALVALEVAPRLQFLSQPLAGPMQANLDRVEADFEDLGDLRVLEALQFAQHHHRPVVLRKAPDELADAGTHLLPD